MTELLQKAMAQRHSERSIAKISQLSNEQQDAFGFAMPSANASRLLAELEDEEAWQDSV